MNALLWISGFWAGFGTGVAVMSIHRRYIAKRLM